MLLALRLIWKERDLEDPYVRFRDLLIFRQTASGMTTTAFSRKLGISQGMWWAVRDGRKRMGRKSLAAAVTAFPELQAEALLFLLASNTPREVRRKKRSAT